ncbi:hypothetical protein SAP269_18770 [Spiroplasma ixodetis]|uniref:Spiroplasmavirus-related protein n=1 Tax=Spiroplasma ixodetis TaxID=2141 RepID=A0ABM8JPM1_9MOLU
MLWLLKPVIAWIVIPKISPNPIPVKIRIGNLGLVFLIKIESARIILKKTIIPIRLCQCEIPTKSLNKLILSLLRVVIVATSFFLFFIGYDDVIFLLDIWIISLVRAKGGE